MSPSVTLPRHAIPMEQAPGTARLDEAGFRALHEATAARLRRYLHRASGDAALAEDVAQETYLRYLRAGADVGSGREAAALLFRIATNLLYDHWRRLRRERRFLGRLRPAAAGQDPGLTHDLGRLLDTLQPRERTLLWLAYVEGYRHEEIAGILGLRPGSVRVLLFRARSKMAAALARAGVGWEVLR